jgi:hypothetical protein
MEGIVPRHFKKPANLSDSLHQRLNSYALAASAAGVGVLASAQPAEAKIVYRRAHVIVGHDSTFFLDLNRDGTTDFTLYGRANHTTSGAYERLAVGVTYRQPPTHNQVWGTGQNASALKSGVLIHSSMKFSTINRTMAKSVFNYSKHTTQFLGPWANGGKGVKNRYLGLQFFVGKETHFGWARLNVSRGRFGLVETLTGYAYETIPNKPIITGKTKGPDAITVQPGSLGALAAGRE